MPRPALSVALLLAACGDPISNRLVLEDETFRAALPTTQTQRVAYDTSASSGIATQPATSDLLVLTIGAMAGINDLIDRVLPMVDEIRALPPTIRTDDSRVWGPYLIADTRRTQVWVRADMTRTEGPFLWEFSWSDAEDGIFEPFVWGEHRAGETVVAGDGGFTIDFNALAAAGESTRGVFEVGYDHRDGREALLRVSEADTPTAAYWFEDRSDEGAFEFVIDDFAFDGENAIDHAEIRTRWQEGQGGRGDAWMEDASWGTLRARFSQCWAVDGELVFQEDDPWHGQDVGSVADCVFAEPEELRELDGLE